MSQNKKILIIDDDPDYVEAIKIILENANYIVKPVYTPKDGFLSLEKEQFDLVILDIMMGRGAEGIIFARKLRQDKKYDTLPVLMITSIREQTGFFFPDKAEHPQFLPVDEVLEKPVESKVLLDKVGSLLRVK